MSWPDAFRSNEVATYLEWVAGLADTLAPSIARSTLPGSALSKNNYRIIMFRQISTLIIFISLLLPAAHGAEWTGGVEGGSVIRDGESSTSIRLRASLDSRPLSHLIYADWIRSEVDAYEFGYKPQLWLGKNIYLYGEGRVLIDESVKIDKETRLDGGIGITLVANKQRQAWLEVGAGYRITDYSTESGLEKAEESLASIRGSASQVLSDLFKFALTGDVSGSEGYRESQLEAGISMRLPVGAVKVSHRVRRIDIDGQDEISDSDTSVGFTVGF